MPHAPAASTRTQLVRLWQYLRPYKARILASVACATLVSLLFTTSIGILKPVGDLLFNEDGLEPMLSWCASHGPTAQWFGRQIEPFAHDRRKALLYLVVLLLVMGMVKNVLRFIQEYLSSWVAERSKMDLTNEMYSHAQTLSVGFFAQHGTQDVISRFVNDPAALTSGLRGCFNRLVREPLKAVGALSVAVLISWRLTLFAAIVFPIAGWSINWLGRAIKRRTKRTLESLSQILQSLAENLHGTKVVQVFCLEDHFEADFQKRNLRLFEDMRRVTILDAMTSPIMEAGFNLVASGIILYTGMLVLDGHMTSGDFFAFYAAMGATLDPVRRLAKLNNRIQGGLAAADRMFEVLDEAPEIQQRPDALPLRSLTRDITFEGVGFSYPPPETGEPGKPVLTDIQLTLRRGELLGIVGRSGAGKSTLVHLLPRFMDPSSGRITIDDVDVRDVRLGDLRHLIGVVTQETLLWNDTVRTNIRLGRLDADDAAIEEAARAANIHDFIVSMPSGYDTLIGEHGFRLSGGQRQRIAIARAILKNPEILILDEATNALDSESEALVQAALDRFVEDRTTLIIAHRLSTLKKADRIVVLQDGRVEGLGTHAELMENSEVYALLYNQQFAPVAS